MFGRQPRVLRSVQVYDMSQPNGPEGIRTQIRAYGLNFAASSSNTVVLNRNLVSIRPFANDFIVNDKNGTVSVGESGLLLPLSLRSLNHAATTSSMGPDPSVAIRLLSRGKGFHSKECSKAAAKYPTTSSHFLLWLNLLATIGCGRA